MSPHLFEEAGEGVLRGCQLLCFIEKGAAALPSQLKFRPPEPVAGGLENEGFLIFPGGLRLRRIPKLSACVSL